MNKFISFEKFELVGYNDCSDIAVIVGDYEFSGRQILQVAHEILDADPEFLDDPTEKT